MAVEVGMGYVSIVPEVQGFAGQLQRQVTGPAESAGQEGGQAAGEGFTGKMGGVLKGGLAAIGLAAAAVLTKGFMDALDQGAINGKIQAQLGSTPEEAKRYGKAAGQLYAGGVTDSVEEAAGAISGVMRSGILPPDATNAQIESITGRVTDLSKTFELDLGQTSNAVGQMLKTGLAKDGAEALDILTTGMQKLGPRADDLMDTFNEYSTVFRAIGLDAKTSMGLISQGMQAGARDTDQVADAIKEFTIEAVAGSDKSAKAFQMVGLNSDKMFAMIGKGGPSAQRALSMTLDALRSIKDPVERSAAATELFGTKSEDMQAALLALDPSSAIKALGDTAGAAEKMGDALHDNAGARIEQFKRGLEVGLTNFIGDKVIPALSAGANFLKTVFGPAFEATQRAVGPVLSEISGGIRAFGAAFRAGGDDITSSGFAGVLEGIGLKARGLFDIFQTSIMPALSGLWGVVSGQLLPAFWQMESAIGGAVLPIFRQIGSILVDVVWPAVMKVYGAILENLQPIFSALAEFMTSRVVPAAQMIGEKLQGVVEKARPLIEVVTSVVSWLGRLVADILGAVIPVIIRLAGPIFSGLFSALGTVIGWIGNVIGWLSSMATGIRDAGRWVADFSSNAIRKFGEFVDWVRGLPKRIKDSLGDFGQLLVDKGADLVRGIWEGVKGMGRWLADTLTGWAKRIIPGPIAKALGIASPSRLMRDEIGRWIPQGIVAGIDSEQSTLDARLQSMVTVPDIGAVRAAGAVGIPRGASAVDTGLADVLRALEGERDRDIVVRIGEQEVARAVAYGQRQLARR
ncbi:phage tail tape measure protein [Streptomyces sp. NPDC048696]|uniref:phage tail tape measure protein n=1 Tax=Streptomyces sp. NPDC048696 TaxID=3365585 RepID=UPI00371F957E